MKATGIVRRIDDLGRVVIPKEIRRTLRIREGDPSQITLKKMAKIQLCYVGFSQKDGMGLVHIDGRFWNHCVYMRGV